MAQNIPAPWQHSPAGARAFEAGYKLGFQEQRVTSASLPTDIAALVDTAEQTLNLNQGANVPLLWGLLQGSH